MNATTPEPAATPAAVRPSPVGAAVALPVPVAQTLEEELRSSLLLLALLALVTVCAGAPLLLLAT